MDVQMVHFVVKPTFVSHFEAAFLKIVRALEQSDISRIRYTMYRSNSDSEFIGVLQLNGVENPLPGLLEGQHFLAGLETWLKTPPVRKQLTLIGDFEALNKTGVKE